MALILRPASADDCRVIFDWASDPVTRAVSFQQGMIDWEQHQEWYAASLRNEARQLLIGMEGSARVGLVRLDQVDCEAVVSINVAPDARGRGLGLLLLQAVEQVARDQGVSELIAYIRVDNLPSVRCFEAAGYEAAGTESQGETQALRYARSVCP